MLTRVKRSVRERGTVTAKNFNLVKIDIFLKIVITFLPNCLNFKSGDTHVYKDRASVAEVSTYKH